MPLRLLGLSGSLRRGSHNTALLHTATRLLPPSAELVVRTVHGIPLFDGDVEAQGWPTEVAALREAIRAADGVILATPEYNHGVPGVLKNAIDWVSRGSDAPLRGKPVGVLSASPGGLGGVRAQLAWLPTLTCIGARVMHAPEFLLSNAGAAFAADGSLADADMARRLRTWLDAFATWSAPTR